MYFDISIAISILHVFSQFKSLRPHRTWIKIEFAGKLYLLVIKRFLFSLLKIELQIENPITVTNSYLTNYFVFPVHVDVVDF